MSEIANHKRNWLEEVKEDAERLTRERLGRSLPELDQKVAEVVANKKAKSSKAKASQPSEVKE